MDNHRRPTSCNYFKKRRVGSSSNSRISGVSSSFSVLSSCRGNINNRRHNLNTANSTTSSKTNNRIYGHLHQKSDPSLSMSPFSSHIICAIGENLARETCVVSLDISAPFVLNVTKQSNGQSYSETVAHLSILCPDEVLMNEGRYHSPLARKVLQHFDLRRRQQQQQQQQQKQQGNGSMLAPGMAIGSDVEATNMSDGRPPDESPVVKFISRSYFDQTKGADLLRRLARQDTYDSTLVEEYILLSSSHALLHYTQLTLGAVSFTKHCLDVRVSSDGHNNQRMEIDRSTLLQLEVLMNNSTINNAQTKLNRKHSLISTMDCTKTSGGHRLLRTTLMAPPCRIDTITARLDLVDTFLHDEDLFYITLQQLQNLSNLDKMLTNIVVVPTRSQQHQRGGHRGTGLGITSNDSITHASVGTRNSAPATTAANVSAIGKSNAANARKASKGISALVCIKSTLATIPLLASILKKHLERIGMDDEEEKRTGIPEVEGEASIATAKTSLLVGLGVGGANTSQLSSSSQTTNHQLLRAIIFALSQPELRTVREAIDGAFTESTTYTKNANAMKHQECFALKRADDNGMMDVLRKAFLGNVDDIYKKADEYAEIYGISHVAVKFSTTRGYYLSLPMEMAPNLPNEFIQPAKSGKYIFCSTEEVQSLNIRAQDNIQDLLLMTHERIQQVLDVARSKYDALARLSDAIALLDLCHSFADKVTLSKLPWTRPSMTDGTMAATEENEKESNGLQNNSGGNVTASSTTSPEGSYAIAICNGRYGIDVEDIILTDGGPGEWVPNDTYADLSKNLTIISGINGSGKSTYLKQIAIIVLLAHCGSYVPAEDALIPLTNRLCARMMTADDQENNISSFMLEMKETAFICNNATSRSLILLDELGRATSNEDGVAIAWAVAESLLAKGAMTYFVTHYPQMCQMSRSYPAVQNHHLKATISNDGDGIQYSHKVGSGPCDATSNYGVEMAASCGWPHDVVKKARSIENMLQDKLTESPLCGDGMDVDTEIEYKKSLKTITRRLVDCVNTDCEPTIDALRTALQALKDSMLETVPKAAITIMLDVDNSDENQMPLL